MYPASDPWVISCGGTIINQVAPLSEDTWNDNQSSEGAGGGATGGGISYLADPVTWQASDNVPVSVNSDHRQGRGLPDVAGNASPSSGYDLWLYGQALSKLVITSGPGAGNPFGVVGGTSAVAPLYAALIALINASLNKRVGYLNPTLYSFGSSGVFRDINDGVSNSVSWTNDDGSIGGPSLGYSSGPGWDACTGWGSIDGSALLSALTGQFQQSGVSPGTQTQTVESP
jgi:kumamolisin